MTLFRRSKKNKTGFIVLVICFMLSGFLSSHAQESSLLYGMRMVPQSSCINPAWIPSYKYYIGFPMLSSINVGIDNGNLRFNDVVYRNEDNSLQFDTANFLHHLKPNNRLTQDFYQQLFFFGVNFGRNSLNFSVSNRINNFMNFTENQARFIIHGTGPGHGENLDMGNATMNSTVFTEIAVGYARRIINNINVGARAKFLIGWGNLETVRSNINMYGDPDTNNVTITSDLLYRYSVPVSNLWDTNGNQAFQYLHNYGCALDIGINYWFLDKFNISASLLDLGFISWPENVLEVRSMNPNVPHTLTGLDPQSIWGNGGINDSIAELQVDSLVAVMDLEQVDGKPYKSWLPPRLYISGSYRLTPRDEFAVTFRNKFYDHANLWALSIIYYRQFGRHFVLTAGNTFNPNSLFDPGAGFAVNAGPIQLYFIVDQISAFMARNMKNFTCQFGINLVFPDENNERQRNNEHLEE
jgi:hypothetical protein